MRKKLIRLYKRQNIVPADAGYRAVKRLVHRARCAIEQEAISFKIFATNSVNIGLYKDFIQSGLPTYDLD